MKLAKINHWISPFTVILCAAWLGNYHLCAQTQNRNNNARSEAEKIRIADTVRVSDERIKNAIDLWRRYMAAVETNDVNRIKKCWAKAELGKNAWYDRRFYSLEKYRATIRNLPALVSDVSFLETDCIRLTIDWQKDTLQKPFFTEKLFVMQEGGKSVLAHALTAMTRNWPGQDTRHIAYRYYPAHRFNARKASAMDTLVENLSDWFQVKLNRKIPYYIFPPKSDPPGFDQWHVSRADLGEGEGRISMVVDWIRDSEASPHEIVHIVQQNLTRSIPCLFLLEGMAAYFGSTHESRKMISENLRKSLLSNRVPTVDSLIQLSYKNAELTPREDLWIKAVGSAAVGYLFERYEKDRLKQFYVAASASPNKGTKAINFVAALKEVYGMTPFDLDAQYKNWIKLK